MQCTSKLAGYGCEYATHQSLRNHNAGFITESKVSEFWILYWNEGTSIEVQIILNFHWLVSLVVNTSPCYMISQIHPSINVSAVVPECLYHFRIGLRHTNAIGHPVFSCTNRVGALEWMTCKVTSTPIFRLYLLFCRMGTQCMSNLGRINTTNFNATFSQWSHCLLTIGGIILDNYS